MTVSILGNGKIARAMAVLCLSLGISTAVSMSDQACLRSADLLMPYHHYIDGKLKKGKGKGKRGSGSGKANRGDLGRRKHKTSKSRTR